MLYIYTTVLGKREGLDRGYMLNLAKLCRNVPIPSQKLYHMNVRHSGTCTLFYAKETC